MLGLSRAQLGAQTWILEPTSEVIAAWGRFSDARGTHCEAKGCPRDPREQPTASKRVIKGVPESAQRRGKAQKYENCDVLILNDPTRVWPYLHPPGVPERKQNFQNASKVVHKSITGHFRRTLRRLPIQRGFLWCPGACDSKNNRRRLSKIPPLLPPTPAEPPRRTPRAEFLPNQSFESLCHVCQSSVLSLCSKSG